MVFIFAKFGWRFNAPLGIIVMLNTLKNYTRKDWIDFAFIIALTNIVLVFCVYVAAGGFYP